MKKLCSVTGVLAGLGRMIGIPLSRWVGLPCVGLPRGGKAGLPGPP